MIFHSRSVFALVFNIHNEVLLVGAYDSFTYEPYKFEKYQVAAKEMIISEGFNNSNNSEPCGNSWSCSSLNHLLKERGKASTNKSGKELGDVCSKIRRLLRMDTMAIQT